MGFFGDVLGKITGAVVGGAGRATTSLLDRGGNYLSRQVFGDPNPSPAELGAADNAYAAARHPGTNPWERLGTQAPGGAQQVQRQQARAARRIARAEVGTQRRGQDVSMAQAKIQGRSAGVAAGAQWGPDTAKKLADYIVGEKKDPGLGWKRESVPQRQASVAEDKVNIEREKLALAQEIHKFDVAHKSVSPQNAALIAMAGRVYNILKDAPDLDQGFKDYKNTLRLAGVGGNLLESLSKIFNLHFLRAGGSGARLYRGRPGRGRHVPRGPSSAPATPKRTYGPDNATKRSREYWKRSR